MLIILLLSHVHEFLKFKQMMNKLDPFDAEDDQSDHEVTTTTTAVVPSEAVADDSRDPKVILIMHVLYVSTLCNSLKAVHHKRSEFRQQVVMVALDSAKQNVQNQGSKDLYPFLFIFYF